MEGKGKSECLIVSSGRCELGIDTTYMVVEKEEIEGREKK